MNELPQHVISYLQRVLIVPRKPAFLIADRNGVLIDLGGSLSAYGLQDLRIGSPLTTQVDWMVGLFPIKTSGISLPSIKTTSQTFADVHLFQNGETYVVLLVDVTSAEIQQGLLQQKANDLSLLRSQHVQFLNVLHEFDIALLEKKAGNTFVFIGKPSEWIGHCGLRAMENANEYRLDDDLEFLSNFVSEAEDFWSHGEGHYKSGPWVESDQDRQEWYFEATAMKSGASKILLIERIAPISDPRFALIQKAREQRLEYIQLARKEESLRKTEMRSRILLQAVPDWIFLVNPEGTILDLKATMGKNPFMFAEFIGQPLTEVFPEEASQKMIECTEEALRQQKLQSCVFSLGSMDAPIPFEARAVAVGPNSVVLLVRDLPAAGSRDPIRSS